MLQTKLRRRSFSTQNFRTRRDLRFKITVPFFDLDQSRSKAAVTVRVKDRVTNAAQTDAVIICFRTQPEPVVNVRLSTHPNRQRFLWHAQNSVEAAKTATELDDPFIAKGERSETTVAKHFVNIENVRYGMHLVLLLAFAKSSSLSFW